MNRVIISGNLGRKPEVRKANSGTAVCNFSIATNDRTKKGDEWVDDTQWHNIVVFGKQAENCERYLDKGSKVLVEGKIRTRSWEDKEGKPRKTTEIIAKNVEFLNKVENGASAPQSKPQSNDSFRDEEIPF